MDLRSVGKLQYISGLFYVNPITQYLTSTCTKLRSIVEIFLEAQKEYWMNFYSTVII